MISQTAHDAIIAEAGRQGKSAGAIASSFQLYFANYVSVGRNNPTWSQVQIEALLLTPTGLQSLIQQADLSFKSLAMRATLGARAKNTIRSAALNVLLSVIGNVIFVILSIAIYASAQNTAKSFFSSLGFEIKVLPDASQSPLKNNEQSQSRNGH